MKLHELTLMEVKRGLEQGDFSSEELVTSVYDRIEETEDHIKAYITLTKEQALAQSKEIDSQRAKGEELGPLAGIPVAIKDNICTKDVTTSCASKILEDFVPPYNATVISKLAEAGAIIVGKTNMDEFAMGSSTENSAFFVTSNPWDTERVPGGSSGGSAASVASAQVPLALGSDTGGSIRQPASFCGVVGMKPTYGRVSRYGLVAFASSLDQIGPLSKNVEDTALALDIISGHDHMDSTSVDLEVPNHTDFLNQDIDELTIGIPKEYYELVDNDVKSLVESSLQSIEPEAGNYRQVSLPTTEHALSAYYLIAPAEASSNLARFDGVRYGQRFATDDLKTMYNQTRKEGFGNEVKQRVMLGTYALSAGYYDALYLKALKVRSLIKQEFEQVFSECDVLIAPTTPTVPFREGENVDDPLTMYKNDICTAPVNLAGLPSISIPCGFSNGLPVGLQVIGKAFDEGKVIQVAHKIEQMLQVFKNAPQQGLDNQGGK
ncbi:Asp-tRNA(Asn)/Glu-tRNA(Gln) amidotransferase subunit GatA [Natranaerobius thermophilus]|uniref:Glutamyl-tRNA(Gln) amidotransferase subunit A n=1 Tax=Natranaerobius thermophilus (strain ATCC BAA-1301 / DSM 18059 / JW/NM-WN-LF) TaxID=457570 RepID=GATA_NATTJ|nr:Asp-tRNA(Asn)/Glu-tRNA(Gln) amidotransferase subunit GatA [Natranaerobius thermophilus]B2A5W7.1 RecName: Full=Glutamyl-tRNA(Gln) amidotransferase subunit A; Short=Glu-ADT subunit A [Natranaerobius thermophilus JW/NM-WN-LF]ACB84060.1 aspartyl/glutamyl-tRNA(Asn/Gln) amidotransferase subunit A [Natranaerobius thermophilus JW/NM-WN-LF]